MCQMLSWIVWKGKTYVISNDEIENNKVIKEKIKKYKTGKDNYADLVGHGIIREAFNIPLKEGIEYENSAMKQPKRKGSRAKGTSIIPAHLVKRIKNGDFSNVAAPAYTLNMLTAAAKEEYRLKCRGLWDAMPYLFPKTSYSKKGYLASRAIARIFWKIFSYEFNRASKWR